MKVNKKTLEAIRVLINEVTEYRSGPKLVDFFNDLGIDYEYDKGFPSRWIFTDRCLDLINKSEKLERCIEKLFLPIDFIGREDELNSHIEYLNKFLAYDGYIVKPNGMKIKIDLLDNSNHNFFSGASNVKEEAFLGQEVKKINIDKLKLSSEIKDIIKQRLIELDICVKNEVPLGGIFLIGSTLEGILFGVAKCNIQKFNQSKSSPKDKEEKVRRIEEWSLSTLIDVSAELGFIGDDVKKFSYGVRDYRNFIHPRQQKDIGFAPDTHTLNICYKVLNLAILDITGGR